MQAPPTSPLDEAAYLELERSGSSRHEFLRGELYAMAGGSLQHSQLQVNLISLLHAALRDRPCVVNSSDLRIKIEETGLLTYPDVSVFCGAPRFVDGHQDTLLNPLLIAEVLSPSTESYDRGAKFAHYRQLESLQEYLLISQEEARVERILRRDDGEWSLRCVTGLEGVLALSSVGVSLPLSELYHKVVLPERPERGPGTERTAGVR